MQKKITVYVVQVGEGEAAKKVVFTTKSQANEAAALVEKFGLEVVRVDGVDKDKNPCKVLPSEKRTVTIE